MSSCLPRRRTLRAPLSSGLVLASLLLAAPARPSTADPPVPTAEERHLQVVALKRIEVDMLHDGARLRAAAAREVARLMRTRKGRALLRARAVHGGPGARARRPVGEELESPVPQDLGAPRPAATPASVAQTDATPTNVQVNNTSGDAAGTGQAEEGMAALGNNVLVAFNDGQGFVTGNPYLDSQGYAYSTDGGLTFTDGGVPPKPLGNASWVWTSDPVVSVNEKTGKFYFLALGTPDGTHNAIGICPGSFSGASFVWDTARVVRSVLNTDFLLDKPWMVADSASGNVYVTMTTFDATTPADWIDFTRSTNGARTWSTAFQISDYATNGLVQGSRPVVGPDGHLYATWQAVGDTIEYDYIKFADSPDRGLTWDPESTPAAFIPNFGTGAPGYNRERGVQFPSIAIDRTRGNHRGRIYLAWSESYDHLDDVFLGTSAKSEVEPNGNCARATPFNVGDILRGQISSASPADQDYWAVNLTSRQPLIVWVDSLVTNETYTVRLFAPAPDSLQRLCYSGDLISDPGQPARQAYFTFDPPKTGLYYLRIAPAFSTSATGNYRIRTKVGQIGTERGRDQRDVFVSASDDGNSWSTPVRVNQDLAGYDNFLPEVSVGPDGLPYVAWRDHRSDPYGSRTKEYVARSSDGGATWLEAAVSSALGDFTASASNLVPNEGDYNSLAPDARYVRAAWSDGRGPSVDVWSTRVDSWFQLATCAHDTVTTAGSQAWMTWRITNLSPLFTELYTYTLTSQRNWALPPDSFSVKPLETVAFIPNIVVPDTAAGGINRICLNMRNSSGALTAQCCANMQVIPGGAGVADSLPRAFVLEPAAPNPSSGPALLRFSLPRPGWVRIRVYGLQGERVRTLADGWRPAGHQSVTWDGRDDRGLTVGAGQYFARVEALGQTVTTRMIRLR